MALKRINKELTDLGRYVCFSAVLKPRGIPPFASSARWGVAPKELRAGPISGHISIDDGLSAIPHALRRPGLALGCPAIPSSM